MSMRETGPLFLILATLGLAACGNNSGTIDPPDDPATPAVTNSYIATSGGRLLGFDLQQRRQSQNAVNITGLTAGDTLRGIAFRTSGTLYALGSNGAAGRLYVITPSTGAATLVAALQADPTDGTAPFTGLNGTSFGLDFNPIADRLRVISNAGQNLRIDPATGLVITDGDLSGAATSASGAAYTNSFAAACRTSLFSIDPASDRVFAQPVPNDGVLNTVGPLGVDATSVGGFDVMTDSAGANAAFAALNTASGASLYTISTTTGSAQNASAITLNAGETVSGFAIVPPAGTVTQAPGELIGLTTNSSLDSFNRTAPARPCTLGSISGLPVGMNLVSLANRPSNNTLIALGTNGASTELYGLTAAGAATLICALIADPADASDPYAGLSGSDFAISFNPVSDRLRLTSNAGQNLRIDPNPTAAGQCPVTTDTPLSSASGVQVTGVAYTNGVAGATSTTLFGIDFDPGALSDNLVRIGGNPANTTAGDPGNPNSGVVTRIGPLGATALNTYTGFVIDGRDNSALVTLQGAPLGASTLYSVNLANGAATALGSVRMSNIEGGNQPLRSLALSPR